MTGRDESAFGRRLLAAGVALGLVLNFAPESAASSPRARVLLALSKSDHNLVMLDGANLRVISRVPVGPDPHEVVASADGTRAYVSNTGGGHFHELDVIDLVAHRALSTVDTVPLLGPHGLAFVGGKVWFTAEGSKSVGRYDPATSRVDWALGTGQDRTHMIHVNADERVIYVTNVASGTVSILKYVTLPPPQAPNMDWIENVVPVSRGAEGFGLSSDGRELWTAAASDGRIYIIDLAAGKVDAILDARIPGANRLIFTPDGKRVLVSSLRTGDFLVYDVASRTELKRLSLGRGAAGMLVDPEGARAFVSCTPDDYVAVVDLGKLEVTRHVDVGGHPDGLAWAVVPK